MKDEEERDNKRDISVIIPVYNVEKYIDQCLDSLQAQSFDNFEVICVDDGSLDHTVDQNPGTYEDRSEDQTDRDAALWPGGSYAQRGN